MGEKGIVQFLSHLAVKESVSASTQNQVLRAITFLYRHVLKIDLGEFTDIVWAKRPKRLPVVLTKEEVKEIIGSQKRENDDDIYACIKGWKSLC